jgi:hypothetical protein
MEQQGREAALLVEVFLHGARVKGLCREIGLRRRLVEILNTPGDTFDLESAFVTLQVGAPMHAPSLAVEKKSIVAAIPWETKEQDRARALDTSVIGRAQTTAVPVVVFSPPFVIAGVAHLTAGYVPMREKLRMDPGEFQHFFPVTRAEINLADGSQLKTPIVLVNRDLVSAMGRTVEPARLRLAS